MASQKYSVVEWVGIIDFESDEDAVPCSHSLTLETLYTWEKKLYKEVKVMEFVIIEHHPTS